MRSNHLQRAIKCGTTRRQQSFLCFYGGICDVIEDFYFMKNGNCEVLGKLENARDDRLELLIRTDAIHKLLFRKVILNL